MPGASQPPPPGSRAATTPRAAIPVESVLLACNSVTFAFTVLWTMHQVSAVTEWSAVMKASGIQRVLCLMSDTEQVC